MKEFLDSKAGRTLIIALIATGTTIFAVPWDGAETVLRAGGGAFFGALAPLVFYLKRNSDEEGSAGISADSTVAVVDFTSGHPVATSTTGAPSNLTVSTPAIDFDKDYHFAKGGERHPGPYAAQCQTCKDAG